LHQGPSTSERAHNIFTVDPIVGEGNAIGMMYEEQPTRWTIVHQIPCTIYMIHVAKRINITSPTIKSDITDLQ
jgi:hypothetical protein